MRIATVVALLAGLAGLGACQSGGAGGGSAGDGAARAARDAGARLRVAVTRPIFTADEPGAKAAVLRGRLNPPETGPPVAIANVMAVASTDNLEDADRHSAYALGFPEQCGGSWLAEDHKSRTVAAMTALRRCVRFRGGFHRHTETRSCGCRLAAIDDLLLIDPAALNWRQRAPGLLFRGDGEPANIMAAYVDGIGANLPMTIFDRAGAVLCQGRYSVDPIEVVFGFGPFSLTCDGGAVAAEGKLSVKKVYLDQGKRDFLVAIGTGKSDDGAPFKFILGIPRRIYDAAPGQFE